MISTSAPLRRTPRRPTARRADRSLRAHRRRCGLTAVLSVGAIAAIWSIDTGVAGTPWPEAPAAVTGDGLVDLFAATARVTASLLLAYLALASTANLVWSFELARRRAPRLSGWFERVAPRWLVMASVGIVASSTLSTTVGAAEPLAPHDDVLMEVIEERTPGAGPDRSPRTMLPWADVIGASPTTLPAPPRLEPVGPDQLPPPAHVERSIPAAPGRLHTVRPGEHFWSIAERTVTEEALDIGVTEYWQRLIDLNRAGLIDPDNPDLIFPGQVLILP